MNIHRVFAALGVAGATSVAVPAAGPVAPVAVAVAVPVAVSAVGCGQTALQKLESEKCCLTKQQECYTPGTLVGSGGQTIPAGSPDEGAVCVDNYGGAYVTCSDLPQCQAALDKAAQGTGGNGG